MTAVAGHIKPEEDGVGLDVLRSLRLWERQHLAFPIAFGLDRLDNCGNFDFVLVICGSGEFASSLTSALRAALEGAVEGTQTRVDCVRCSRKRRICFCVA